MVIYFFILGLIFLLAYGLFFLYWPSRQFSTVPGTTVLSFPPEFGFLFFILSVISFIIGLVLYKKSKKNNELSLFTSVALIIIWFLFFSTQYLKDILLFVRPDIVKLKDQIIGFTIPSYGFNLNLILFNINIPSFEYLHLLLLVGILGIILFYKSFNSMILKIRIILKKLNKFIDIEYKIAFILSTLVYSIILLMVGIYSQFFVNSDLIIVLIETCIITGLIFSFTMIYVFINNGLFHIDRTKIAIRKNSLALGILLMIVYSTSLDLMFLFFFTRISAGESFYWQFRDVITNSLFTGMIYLEISLGITLVYKILKFANFAHAELVTFGAYMAFVFASIGDSIGTWNLFSPLGYFKWIPMFITLGIISFVMTALLAYIFDLLLFKPLRNRESSSVTLMIASFALGLSFRMVLQQIFTANPIFISEYMISINLDSVDVRILIIALVLFSTWFFQILLYKTKYGKIMRAVSDNEDLAKISGIKASRIHILVWIIAGGFAGVAGLLYSSYNVGVPVVTPDVGFTLLLSAFAVAVLGGIGSFEGVVLASLIVGFTENMGVIVLSQIGSWVSRNNIIIDIPVIGITNGIPILTNFIASLSFDPGYKVALSYIILIIVLKIRPYGLLGEKPSGDR